MFQPIVSSFLIVVMRDQDTEEVKKVKKTNRRVPVIVGISGFNAQVKAHI